MVMEWNVLSICARRWEFSLLRYLPLAIPKNHEQWLNRQHFPLITPALYEVYFHQNNMTDSR